MKNIHVRAISGAVYVMLTIGCILSGEYSLFAYFLLTLSYTLYEFYKLYRKGGYRPQIIIGLLISTFLFVSFFLFNREYCDVRIFRGIIPLLIIVPIVELFRNAAHPVQNIGITFFGIVYITLPFSVLTFLIAPWSQADGLYSSTFLIALFLIIWANDTGAYLWGSWRGKTKMFERISPNKTWEGAIGGAVVAIVVSVIYFYFKGSINLFHAAILGLLTVVAGTLGDLTESMLKRNAKVKDSGSILPGHGGLLDRFDSMLFAAPIYYFYLTLILK